MFSPLLLLIKNLKKLLPLKVNILFEKHADKFPDRFHLKKKNLNQFEFSLQDRSFSKQLDIKMFHKQSHQLA